MTATSNRTYYHKVQDYSLPISNPAQFRSFGNRKKYFKSTTVTLQDNDVRIYLCLHCITVNNNKNNYFFCRKHFFHFFFHVHLSILDEVVSS
jgi:hypothetical protein